MSNKIITWQSWNAMADEYISILHEEFVDMTEELLNMGSGGNEMGAIPMGFLRGDSSNVIHTPLGIYPIDSMFKPSDRWDCRIGTTNFCITHNIKNQLAKEVKGVEALKIMGRYTFFIGVPHTFDFRDVRADIERRLCVFTEEEVMNEETKKTVALVKEQLKNDKYWSILVASTGKVDYVVSDKLDQKYLDGLAELVETKQSLGGIILNQNNLGNINE
jgi:hypothetical protein